MGVGNGNCSRVIGRKETKEAEMGTLFNHSSSDLMFLSFPHFRVVPEIFVKGSAVKSNSENHWR